MIVKNKKNLRKILLPTIDMIVVVLAHLVAISLRYEYSFSELIQHVTNRHWIIIGVVVTHLVSFYIYKINRSLWEFVSVDEALRVTISVIIADAFLYRFFLVVPIYRLSKSVLLIALVFSITGILGLRIAYRYIRLRKKISQKTEKAVIIGAGSAGNILYREIINNDKYVEMVVGFIDDDHSKKGHIIDGYKILGNTNELIGLRNKYDFSIAYIAIPSASKNAIRDIVLKCQEANLKTRIMEISEISNKSSIREIVIEDLLGRGEVELDNSSINKYLGGKRILVTGAGGSIGSELCRQIVKFLPSNLIMVDIYENNLYDLQMEFDMLKRKNSELDDITMEFIIASVIDQKALNSIFDEYKPQVVYHAAAHKHVPLMETVPREAFINNVYGSYRVINACIDHKVEKFILISTDKAVNPTNVMGATKRIVELMVQAYKNNGITNLSAVRFGNVLNSHGSVIPLFRKQIETDRVVTITDPEIKRYFMTIPEASQLVIQAGAYANNGEIFVLDMGQPVKILELAENLIRLSGLKPYDDVQIEFIGLRTGEKLFEELVYDAESSRKTDNDLIFIAPPEDVDVQVFEQAIKELKEKVENDIDIKKELLEFIYRDFSNKFVS